MVKITRNPVPPASLAAEALKANGDYAGEDVVLQLRQDFHDKCYLCELKDLSDPEVEHLRPHYNRKRKELVFDWNNLFYSCRHCNSIKKNPKYDDKVIDCCLTDPELVLEHTFENGHVKILSRSKCESEVLTAELIQNCFELTNTGIRVAACQYRVDQLSKTMGTFFRTLYRYKAFPDQVRYRRSLEAMLDRSSPFAAFKREYVRSHLSDYTELKELVIDSDPLPEQ